MAIDTTECRAWAEATKAAWEIVPLVEHQRGTPVQVGFELNLYGRIPAEIAPGPEREAAAGGLWDRLREIAESLLPLAGTDGRIEVDPFEAAARLRPETQFAPEMLLTARLFHGSDLLQPVEPGERERLQPLEARLHELGLKPRSW
jgi:hypothetical protein